MINENGVSASENEGEIRCLCGSLLARLCAQGIELKCKRCKRFHVIPPFFIEERRLREDKQK